MDGINTETAGFRLSPQQQQLLSAVDGAPEVTQCAVALAGPVDLDRLRQALYELATRHEILRTTFVRPAGVRIPQQAIGEQPQAAVALAHEQQSSAALDDANALARLLETEAQAFADISQGPTVRTVVVGEGERQLLVISVPSACADAGSLTRLVRELCEAYSGTAAGDEPVQYADYAEWRHALIAEQEPEAQAGLAYWREDAAERPASPQILFVGQENTGQMGTGAILLELGAIDLGELQRAAIGVGVNVPVFLEAAWHTLLARTSGVGEILIAGRSDGRAQPELAEALGAFEQPTPIHSRFAQTTTFAEVADQVRRSRAAAVRCQDCATAEDLAALVEQAGAGWSFQTATPSPTPATRLLALRPALGGARLLLSLRAGAGELAGELLYNRAAVPAQDAQELASRYAILLGDVVADASRTVIELRIVDEAERRDALRLAGLQPNTEATAVHELLARQAELTPERVAVLSPESSLTYGQLEEAANRLAHRLRELDTVERATVGLCMERTPAMIVALMGILKAGASYLPLNYDHPPARLAHQLSEVGAQLLVTEEHLLERVCSSELVSELNLRIVCTDRDADSIAACPAQRPDLGVDLKDLAYVMYTSGSTGTPKGVKVTHGNIAGYTASIAARLSEQGELDGAVFGVVSAISTDLGNTSIFAPLTCGGAIRLIGAQAAMDGDLLADELGGARLDALKIAPSHLRALLAAGEPAVLPVKWLIVGGEALTWELVEQVRSLSGECRILNHYGPTETTVGCTTYLVDDEPRPDAATVPIGFPLAVDRTYVLDRRSEPLPAGVPGELCVGGAGVAAGYLGDADGGTGDEACSGFVADPFATERAGCMYRTGDRVRRLRDGAIEFLGRLDDQVKIRGFRVQPAEIEARLRAHPAVRAVAVCAKQDHAGALRLIAYLVSGDPPSVAQLRVFLAETLPEHMIPAAFSTVEALPLTASGKVDRAALADLGELQAKREAEYVAPRDSVEQQIADVWAELLGLDRVGAYDDFFALGGHSLLATQATMRIRRLYGDIPLRALLAAPTVEALAEVVRTKSDAAVAAR
jgi:amino acid adenylation domain-containing protein